MKYILIILLITASLNIFADFMIPMDDEVYPFLEMASNQHLTEINLSLKPLYYNDIMKSLDEIIKQNAYPRFSDLAKKHSNHLNIKQENGFRNAIYPLKKIPNSFINTFKSHEQPLRLFTYAEKDTTFLYTSGLLGYKYDLKNTEKQVSRTRKYYGIESAGNFYDNFGYYLQFKKGGFTGDVDFIKENPDLSIMGNDFYHDNDTYYQVDLKSEVDYKNKYLNLSTGYSTFKIGYSFTSSIILNQNVTPYGYLKYYKNIGNFTYTGITTQLIPDSLKNETDYKSKSYALQMLTYKKSWLTMGVGNAIMYSDNTINIAYSSPLAIYKILDNKFHGRDNGVLFGFANITPGYGLNIYGNFLADDLTQERFTTKYIMSYLAFQGGFSYQFKDFPLEIGQETTAIGQGTYGHKSGLLTYTQDSKLLGSEWGSNFLSFSARVRYTLPNLETSMIYENVQQGDMNNNPLQQINQQVAFLENDILRKERISVALKYRPFPEIFINALYQYNDFENNYSQYLYTGIEYKY